MKPQTAKMAAAAGRNVRSSVGMTYAAGFALLLVTAVVSVYAAFVGGLFGDGKAGDEVWVGERLEDVAVSFSDSFARRDADLVELYGFEPRVLSREEVQKEFAERFERPIRVSSRSVSGPDEVSFYVEGGALWLAAEAPDGGCAWAHAGDFYTDGGVISAGVDTDVDAPCLARLFVGGGA